MLLSASFCKAPRKALYDMASLDSGGMLSLMSSYSAQAPEFQVLESEQRDGYRVSLIGYRGPFGDEIHSYLLVPDGLSASRKAPSILLLHDHGARFDIGKEKVLRPLPSAPANVRLSSSQWVEDNCDGAYLADSLARGGYVVLASDALYWGERSTSAAAKWSRVRFLGEEGNLRDLKDEVYEGQRAVYDSLLTNEGRYWAVQTYMEDCQGVELLSSLPYVDGDRTGAFGWSMGAHRCWILASFCGKVKTGAALCWMTLKRTCASPPTASDHSMMIPPLRDRYDFPDIARSLSPKPFMFLSGDADKLFPKESTAEAFSLMQEIYRQNGAEGKLTTEFFEGGHHCGPREQERIMQYFRENL